MQTIKQIIQDIAAHLPEQAIFDDAMYAIYVRQKLEHSLQAQRKAISHHRKRWKSDTWVMRVEWSNFARDDLVQFISRNSSFYARGFGEKIVLATTTKRFSWKQAYYSRNWRSKITRNHCTRISRDVTFGSWSRFDPRYHAWQAILYGKGELLWILKRSWQLNFIKIIIKLIRTKSDQYRRYFKLFEQNCTNWSM